MAGGTLESTFGIKTLSGLVKTFADEPGQKLFTDLFEKSGKRIEPDGRIVEWDEVTMARALAPVVGESSPFPDATSTQIIARQAPMFDIKLKVDIPASRLFSDRAAGELKDNASSVIANEVQSLTKRVMLTREYAACKALEGSFATSGVAGSGISFTLSQTTNTLTEATDPWPGSTFGRSCGRSRTRRRTRTSRDCSAARLSPVGRSSPRRLRPVRRDRGAACVCSARRSR
jgi:hypothetical protein